MATTWQILLMGCGFLHSTCAWECSPNSTANDFSHGLNLSNKVAVVTGGDSGLGLAAAEAFARAGAQVIIAGHSEEKVQEVAANMSRTFGVRVDGLSVDLGSLASVRRLAANVTKLLVGSLDFLINDAGILTTRGGDMTADGFETIFATNFLGHFLLTEMLLPSLRKSGNAHVVNVASTAALTACTAAGWYENCLQDFTYLPPPAIQGHPINGTRNKAGLYGLSKFLMIQHASELASREQALASGVEAFSVGPGIVDTGITPEFKVKHNCEVVNNESNQSGYGQDPCPYTSAQGAAVIMYCALGTYHPIPHPRTGGWFLRYTGCKEDPPLNMQGFSAKMRSELYTRALRWVGLTNRSDDHAALFV